MDGVKDFSNANVMTSYIYETFRNVPEENIVRFDTEDEPPEKAGFLLPD